jgi:cytidylate kinase
MYRAFALVAIRKNAHQDKARFVSLLTDFTIEFRTLNDIERVFCNGEDVTDEIRTPEISMWASTLSKEFEVRKKMGELQRKIGEKGKIVAEGRDMGTVVFPDAFVKFFLNATKEVRAERRYKELVAKGINLSFEEVLTDIIKRDEQDSNRDLAPLKPAPDALIIDTSSLKVEEVVDIMYKKVMERINAWKS